ncbi:MAG TPA: hypothetical protein VMD51_14595 [Mycobacterium sp.]|nr:hypothetical protein [Mycobacterium sp.]
MNSAEHEPLRIDVDHSRYLAAGSRTVDAIVAIAGTNGPYPDLTLRVWTPAGGRVEFLRQVGPDSHDLTGLAAASGERLTDFPLGPSSSQQREYHIRIDVEPADVGREKLTARVSVVAGGDVVGSAKMPVIWTDDPSLSAGVNPRVAHHTGQSELAQAIHDGLAARDRGEVDIATARLKRALILAEGSGDRGTAELLRRVVEFDDHAGTARLRPELAAADRTALEARTTRTARVREEP